LRQTQPSEISNPKPLDIVGNSIPGGLTSSGQSVSIYTVTATLIVLIVGLYVFFVYNFITGFIMVVLAAVYYFAKKRQMAGR